MFKQARAANITIEYPVLGASYVSRDGNLWTYNAYVQMNSKYEVRDVVLTEVDCENIFGEEVNELPSKVIKDEMRNHASKLALERVCNEDFELQC